MIDPRGPRLAAWVTTAVLAVVVLTGSAALLATAAALSAALLNAAFGICLGCEIYLRILRTTANTHNRNGATA